MQPLKEVKYIVIHHTQWEGHSIESLKSLHIEKNGWEDIGYHFVIGNGLNTEDGKIYPAREEKFIGAHVLGFNSDSLGIALVGNFDVSEPSKKQIESLKKLILEKIKKYGVEIENIKGHREFQGVIKSCPGKSFNLDKLRKEIRIILDARSGS